MSTIASQVNVSATAAYWDEFYSGRKGLESAPRYPSQFAAFVVNELEGTQAIIEFGCGNGRDSEFFAAYGLKVLAMDASREAIELCRDTSGYPNIRYMHQAAQGAGPLIEDFVHNVQGASPVAVYARFFLHAITENEQSEFFAMLEASLPKGSYVYLEYRTERDEACKKQFGNHYRRFLSHHSLTELLNRRGFKVQYEIEGHGLAKYKDEDALVGRCIALKE